MIAAIRAFLLALPTITDLLIKALHGIQEIIETEKENALLKKEIFASQKAALSKDSSDLEQVFREGSR